MRKWLPILLPGLLFLALYLATLTSVHTYDALSYILDVDRKPWRELFHPHHLAYGPLGALIRGAATALGRAGSAERLLQFANALAGALGVTLFAAIASVNALSPRAGGPSATAGATAGLLLGASYAYWYYAVEVEVYTIAAVFLIVCLGLLLALARDPSPRLAAALGVAQGCAVLFHQTNVLLVVPALVALLLGDQRPKTKDQRLASVGHRLLRGLRLSSFVLRLLSAYALPLALIVGGAYLGVGLGVSGFRSWGELQRWAAGYTTMGLWGGPVGAERLGQLGVGVGESLLERGGLVVALVFVLLLPLIWPGLRRLPRGLAAICLSWLLVYGAFFVWWEPDNIEFWIASMPPLYLLLVVATRKSPPLQFMLGSAVLLACATVMLTLNLQAIGARGDAARDRQRLVLDVLAAGSDAGDLFVAPDGLLELYLPFYAGRHNVSSLSQAMATTNGNWVAACELLRGRIMEAVAGGYAVRIGDEAMRPVPAPPGEPPTPAERFGLGVDEVAACYAPFAPALERREAPAGSGLPGYAYLPRAQELADGPGWDFTRAPWGWGWRATGAEQVAGDGPGWALRPGVDPAVSSPPLRLEAGRYGALVVTLAADTEARDAQLFFVDAAGQVDEARSARFTLEAGPGPHTYTIPLRGAPGWEGIVTGLRLDPVGAGDGGTVVVQGIRLVP